MRRLGLLLVAAVMMGCFVVGSASHLAAQTPEATTSARKRLEALELVNQLRYAEAIPLLDELAAENPKDAEVLERLGVSIINNAATLKDAELRKQARLRGRTWLSRAKELGDNSDLLQTMLELTPEDGADPVFSNHKGVDAAMQQGEAEFAKGNYKGAIEAYTRAMLIDPNSYFAALFIGDSYYAQHTYGSACEWFSRAAQIDPDQDGAFRYWGDTLMQQGKPGEARLKYIEAIIAQPYSRNTWSYLKRWADSSRVTISQPDIKSPNSFQVLDGKDKDGQPNMQINLDAGALTKQDGSSAWMMYEITRSAWQVKLFQKEFPDEKQYRHTLREEVQALKLVADTAGKDLKAKKTQQMEPGLATLIKLNEQGLLEAYILLGRPDQGIAQDYSAYRKANRDKLRRYLDEYVVPKLSN